MTRGVGRGFTQQGRTQQGRDKSIVKVKVARAQALYHELQP